MPYMKFRKVPVHKMTCAHEYKMYSYMMVMISMHILLMIILRVQWMPLLFFAHYFISEQHWCNLNSETKIIVVVH